MGVLGTISKTSIKNGRESICIVLHYAEAPQKPINRSLVPTDPQITVRPGFKKAVRGKKTATRDMHTGGIWSLESSGAARWREGYSRREKPQAAAAAKAHPEGQATETQEGRRKDGPARGRLGVTSAHPCPASRPGTSGKRRKRERGGQSLRIRGGGSLGASPPPAPPQQERHARIPSRSSAESGSPAAPPPLTGPSQAEAGAPRRHAWGR